MPLMRLSAPALPRAQATSAGAEGAGTSADMAAARPATASVNWLLASYAVVAGGAIVAVLLWWWRNPAPFSPASGISVFAPLYILAQAIERVIDPFTSFVTAKAPDDSAKKKDGTAIAAGEGVKRDEAVHAVNEALVAGEAKKAADWQAVVDQIRKNTAIIAWTAATVLGMVLCGLLGLFMLRLVGFADVPKQIDIIISGIAVGSGTKPLHDLISNLQSAKDEKQDPSEKKAS